jgi:hypothetical protein
MSFPRVSIRIRQAMKNSTSRSSRRPLLAMVASAACLLTVASREARAWEAATTHAGLTEQAALAADLHRRLSEEFGASNGLYSQLTVPEADAPSLFKILRRLNPTHGYVPNAKGKMSAMAWLAAGSVVADVPGEDASNHFLDPRSGHGLSGNHAGDVGHKMCRAVTGLKQAAQITSGGEPASAWWKSPDNPMGYVGFLDQFRKAVRSTSQGERDRHLAGALLAAGSMLHVLQDMGSPAHVRDDLAAFEERVSPNYYDRGSRFERIAALAFGRLGVPRASKLPTLPALDSHFSNAASTGLADIIESSYFSDSTLPGTTKVYRDAGASVFREAIVKRLKRPEPSPHSRLDIVAARNHEGATWRNDDGVCLTRYRLRRAEVKFWIDDDCALEQMEAILPSVAAYSASFLQALFPNDLSLSKEAGKLVVKMDAKRYGEGNLTFFADAADGTRSEYFANATGTGAATETGAPLPPRTAIRVTVLFDGKDALGNPLLAARSYPWPFAKTAEP